MRYSQGIHYIIVKDNSKKWLSSTLYQIWYTEESSGRELVGIPSKFKYSSTLKGAHKKAKKYVRLLRSSEETKEIVDEGLL